MVDLARTDLAGSAGGAAGTVWDGRVVGTGLHSSSDEFTEDTIASGKWGLWNHGANLNASVNTTERCMVLQMTGNTAVQWAGVYQPKPSNAFSFAAQFNFDSEMGVSGGNPFAGLALFTDATAAAGAAASWGGFDWERDSNASNWPMRLRQVTAWDGASAIDTREYYGQLTSMWLRGRIAITANTNWTVRGDWSSDGVAWNEWRSLAGVNSTTRATAGLTAQHFGLSFLQLPASTSRVKVKHFRVWDGVNAFNSVPQNGGYL